MGTAPTTSGTARRDRILEAFKGQVPPVPVPFHYRLGLFFAACTMVLLPLVYLAMAGAAGYGLYLYVAWYFGIGAPPGGVVEKSIWHWALMSAWAIAVFFLLKPLLARQAHAHDSRKLFPLAEPRMFSFVQKLCESVNAPAPDEIRVNCDVNASAGFGHGVTGLFSNRLILTFGMQLECT